MESFQKDKEIGTQLVKINKSVLQVFPVSPFFIIDEVYNNTERPPTHGPEPLLIRTKLSASI